MGEVARYSVPRPAVEVWDERGRFVAYSDYAKLEQEVQRLMESAAAKDDVLAAAEMTIRRTAELLAEHADASQWFGLADGCAAARATGGGE